MGISGGVQIPKNLADAVSRLVDSGKFSWTYLSQTVCGYSSSSALSNRVKKSVPMEEARLKLLINFMNNPDNPNTPQPPSAKGEKRSKAANKGPLDTKGATDHAERLVMCFNDGKITLGEIRTKMGYASTGQVHKLLQNGRDRNPFRMNDDKLQLLVKLVRALERAPAPAPAPQLSQPPQQPFYYQGQPQQSPLPPYKQQPPLPPQEQPQYVPPQAQLRQVAPQGALTVRQNKITILTQHSTEQILAVLRESGISGSVELSF